MPVDHDIGGAIEETVAAAAAVENVLGAVVEEGRRVEFRHSPGAHTQGSDARRVIVARRPFREDLLQGEGVCVIGGRAADEDVIASSGVEGVAADATDEDVAALAAAEAVIARA